MSERRYHRPLSPPGGGRRMANPARSSTGSLNYASYDPYYPPSRIGRDLPTSPRSSTEGFTTDPRLPPSRVYQTERPPGGHYYGGYPRPRRPTYEAEGDLRTRPVVSSGLRPVVHPEHESPRDVILRPGEHDADYGYYITSEASGRNRQYHQRNSSAEQRNLNPLTGRPEPPDSGQIRQPRTGDYREYGKSERHRGYHLSGSSARKQQPNDDGAHRYDNYGSSGYGYPGAGDPYLERAPRRPRAGSMDTPRGERPISMMELQEYLPRATSVRERGPPPSTRGFDRLAREPASGYADPRYLAEGPGYELIGEESAVQLGRRASNPGRRRPVSLHQDDYGHQLRHREDMGLSDDRERERERRHRRSEAEQMDRRTHHATGQVHHDRRSYEGSSDSLSDREEDTHRHRSHRHRRHRQDEEYGGSTLRAGELEDRTPADRHEQDDHSNVAREHEKRRHERETHKGKVREHDNGHREREPLPDSPQEHGGSRVDHVKDRRDELSRDRKTSNERPASSDDRESHVRVISPPREKEAKAPLKGILREPREKFPEDPSPVREGVAPLKEALKDGRKGIPPGARWTKIDRRRVNPAALEEAHERFEERPDHVIVLRVLTREEIEVLASRTKEIREARDRERHQREPDKKNEPESHHGREHEASSPAHGTTSDSDSDQDMIFERDRPRKSNQDQ
ncbi:MAG: hypothetical protein M1816_007993 [Peltula sp. TS41687]|nr:MAG: hypothetical protein M1816_007993 [Peltula sp. TS41687]